MGTKDGSIIATIITTHMQRNDAAAPGPVCPGIRIHAIDIVQPPGIGITPIADMDAHQTIVTAALAAEGCAAAWDLRPIRSTAMSSGTGVTCIGWPPRPALFSTTLAGCASWGHEPLESKPKSLPCGDAQGIVHPTPTYYARRFASGARD